MNKGEQATIDALDFKIARMRLQGMLLAIKNRDRIVSEAFNMYFSKKEIHELTGLAYSTINGILARQTSEVN